MKIDKQPNYSLVLILLLVGIGVTLSNFLYTRSFTFTTEAKTDIMPKITAFPTTKPKPTMPMINYYLRTSNWTTASPNIASTLVFGCDPGDIVINGGIDGYTGTLSQWRTIRAAPSESVSDNSFIFSVINQGASDGQYTITVRCYHR